MAQSVALTAWIFEALQSGVQTKRKSVCRKTSRGDWLPWVWETLSALSSWLLHRGGNSKEGVGGEAIAQPNMAGYLPRRLRRARFVDRFCADDGGCSLARIRRPAGN